jgi:hypothetical protein
MRPRPRSVPPVDVPDEKNKLRPAAEHWDRRTAGETAAALEEAGAAAVTGRDAHLAAADSGDWALTCWLAT